MNIYYVSNEELKAEDIVVAETEQEKALFGIVLKLLGTKWSTLVNTDEEIMPAYPIQEYYPLTENQLGIYIDWEQHRDSLQYNVPLALKLRPFSRGLCSFTDRETGWTGLF